MKYLGEVFHPDNVGKDKNFFTYAMSRARPDEEVVLPDMRYSLFEAFLAEQGQNCSENTLIIDVKYRSLHHLDGGWRGLAQPPTLLSEAIARNIPIIHLTRRNAVQSFVSGRLAEANRIWHARSDQSIEVRSTVVNIRQLSNYIINTEREIQLIEDWTKRYSNLVEVDYSELFDEDGLISGRASDRITSVLGSAPLKDRTPSFVKQAPASLVESIENFELVQKALKGTGYEWMLS